MSHDEGVRALLAQRAEQDLPEQIEDENVLTQIAGQLKRGTRDA